MERKVKYTYEFKLQCVEEVLKQHRSAESVANEHGFAESNLRRRVCFYQKFGSKGLKPRQYQTYDPTFKLKVLTAIDKKSLSLSEACLSFNIPNASIIVSWQKRFEKSGNFGLEDKPKGRQKPMAYKRAKKKSDKPLTREEELLLENESLRIQVDYLKKLQALIQAEEAAQNKRRKP